MLKMILDRVVKKMGSVFAKKTTADKWAQKQVKQMAKLRGRIILM